MLKRRTRNNMREKSYENEKKIYDVKNETNEKRKIIIIYSLVAGASSTTCVHFITSLLALQSRLCNAFACSFVCVPVCKRMLFIIIFSFGMFLWSDTTIWWSDARRSTCAILCLLRSENTVLWEHARNWKITKKKSFSKQSMILWNRDLLKAS